MKYIIAVEVEQLTSLQDLVRTLQACFDEGAAGFFQVLNTTAPSFVVLFERDAAEDAEYLCKRLGMDPATPTEQHAMQQLADELSEASDAHIVGEIVAGLTERRATVFDFGSQALSQAIAEHRELAPA